MADPLTREDLLKLEILVQVAHAFVQISAPELQRKIEALLRPAAPEKES